MRDMRFVKALAGGEIALGARTATVLVVTSGVSAAFIAFCAHATDPQAHTAGPRGR
jgi:hypothetical protein